MKCGGRRGASKSRRVRKGEGAREKHDIYIYMDRTRRLTPRRRCPSRRGAPRCAGSVGFGFCFGGMRCGVSGCGYLFREGRGKGSVVGCVFDGWMECVKEGCTQCTRAHIHVIHNIYTDRKTRLKGVVGKDHHALGGRLCVEEPVISWMMVGWFVTSTYILVWSSDPNQSTHHHPHDPKKTHRRSPSSTLAGGQM